MRIGIDASFLQSGNLYTGMGVYTRNLTRALAALNGEHEIVLLGYGPRPAAASEPLPWQQVARLPLGRLSPWLSHQVALPLAARRLGLDVLHVPGVNLRLSQPGVPVVTPCPLVVTVHDAIPVTYYGRQGPALPWRLRAGYWLAMQAVRRAAAIVTVSETSRRDILTDLAVQPDRVHVVYNGLDFPEALPAAETDAILVRLGITRPYLLYAGSYEPRKNLLGAVTAYRLALVQRDLPPLVMIVERESGHKEAVLHAVARSGVANHLHFVHSLTDVELATVYRNTELFIYPSYYEGFGFVPLQALACGVPVIAANTGSLPEVLGDAAHYVTPEAPETIAQAMCTLLDHPELAAAVAAKGPAQAARFRWSAAARAMLHIYEQTASRQVPSCVSR